MRRRRGSVGASSSTFRPAHAAAAAAAFALSTAALAAATTLAAAALAAAAISNSVGASIFATGILVVGAQAGNPPWQRAASLLGAIAVYNQIWKQLWLRRAISPEDLPAQNTALDPSHAAVRPPPPTLAPLPTPARNPHRARAPPTQ